jgi:hypothetical protein
MGFGSNFACRQSKWREICHSRHLLRGDEEPFAMTDKCAISAIAAGLAVIVAAFSVAVYSLAADYQGGRAQAQSAMDGKAPDNVPNVPLGASNG